MPQSRSKQPYSMLGFAALREADPTGESQGLQHLHHHPGGINFPPFQPMASGVGKGMVVIVPAFPIGYERDPPAVGGLVPGVVGAIAKFVGGTVDKPGAVVDQHQPHKDAPDHKGPTADRKQQHPKRNLHGEEISIEKLVDRVVVDIFGQTFHLGSCRGFKHHPPNVTPPESLVGVMLISILVRMEMVVAVEAHPPNHPAFTGEGAAEGQEIFQPLGGLEATMGDQTMPAEGNAKPASNPMEQ